MIDTKVLVQNVMLASPSNTVASTPHQALTDLHDQGWRFDVKWDGVRCMAYVEDDKVKLRNRNNVDITERYPDVAAALLETYRGEERCLDGEIICLGADGKPDFNRLSKRDRQTTVSGTAKLLQSHPAIFVAFDLLWSNGGDLRAAPYEQRRALLDSEPSMYEWDPLRLWLSPASDNGPAMWQIVQDQELEGLIAKAPSSTYRAGRDRAWVKVKVVHRATVIVTGWEEGTGKRKGRIGALLVSVLDASEPSGMREVGKLGTGLTDKELAYLQPIVCDPAYGGSLIVEAEYANFTKDKRLRFPSYKGVRTDVPRRDCTIDQFDRA